LVASCLSACASTNTPIDGVVIDATTGKPIPGAFVIAQWFGHGSAAGVHSRTTCPHAEIVQADARGRYKIPETGVKGNVERDLFSYMPGYEWFLQAPEDERVMTMRPFAGTAKERFDSFRTYDSLRSCAPWDNPEMLVQLISKLRPLYSALDEETKELEKSGVRADQLRTYSDSLTKWEKDIKAGLEDKRR
jgi:hypothetical protein